MKVKETDYNDPKRVAEQFTKFIGLVQSIQNDFRRTDVVGFLEGSRYYKVILESEGGMSRSVYCFVDRNNGDIYKAASWNGPAKGVRGSIFDLKDAETKMTAYGAFYL
jgi:hypothetical protein